MHTSIRSSLLAAVTLLAVCSTQAQSIIGAWSYGNTASPTATGTGVFVFLSNNVYFHAESENLADALNGQSGMERGTYTWNPLNGAFTSTTTVNTNGQWGLSHDSPAAISITDDVMDIDGFTLNRVTGASPIVGAWTYGNTATPDATGTGLFVFLANNVYFHIESENTADALNGQNGMERGTYTWAPTTFTVTSVAVNTNGEWGLSDDPGVSGIIDIAISGNVLTVDGGPMTLERVSAIPEPSTYAAFAGLGALGLALWRRRRAQASA